MLYPILYRFYATILEHDKMRIKINNSILQNTPPPPPPAPPRLERQNATYPSHNIFTSGSCRNLFPEFISTVLQNLERDGSIERKIAHLVAADNALKENTELNAPLSHYIMGHYYDNLDVNSKKKENFCKLLLICYTRGIQDLLFKINSLELILYFEYYRPWYTYETIVLIISEGRLLKIAEKGDDGYTCIRNEIDRELSKHYIYAPYHHMYSHVSRNIKCVANMLWFIRMLPAVRARWRQRMTFENLWITMMHFFSYEETTKFVKICNDLKI